MEEDQTYWFMLITKISQQRAVLVAHMTARALNAVFI